MDTSPHRKPSHNEWHAHKHTQTHTSTFWSNLLVEPPHQAASSCKQQMIAPCHTFRHCNASLFCPLHWSKMFLTMHWYAWYLLSAVTEEHGVGALCLAASELQWWWALCMHAFATCEKGSVLMDFPHKLSEGAIRRCKFYTSGWQVGGIHNQQWQRVS